MIKKLCILLLLLILFQMPNNVKSEEVSFCKDKSMTSLVDELQETNKTLPGYLKSKYNISDYKKAREYKYKVCGALVYDCYNVKANKYFIDNIKHVDKWGSFYFGLFQNDHASEIVHSIGQCESGYNPKTVSADQGYGVFQITPGVIGDKSIKKNQLLDLEYNTQYGIFHLNGFYKSAKKNYSDIGKGNEDFIWYMTVRGYNGGFKWLDRIAQSSLVDKYLVSGNFIDASKVNGRFVCYEKVNQVYPLKVYKTAESLHKKSF